MDDRPLRLTGRILRAAGLCLMIASTSGGLLLRASASVSFPWPRLHLAPIAQPTPSPSPSQAPPATHTGGPVNLSITGSLTLGERLSQSSRTTAANESTGNAGMLAELTRRTGSTSLRLAVPAGITGRFSNFGELQGEYSTPRYALTYASQGISALGALPLGGTLRGLTLTVPWLSGDLSVYGGPGFGENGQLLKVTGLRARTLVRGQLVELGYSNAVAADQSASVRSIIFGLAATTPKLNTIFESAVQQSTIGSEVRPVRLSYSMRADYGAGDSYASATLRHIGDSFVSLGTGIVQSEDFASIGVRHSSGANSWSFDEGVGRAGSGDLATSQRRGTFMFSHSSLRNGATMQLSVTDQRQANASGSVWNGGLGLDAAFSYHQLTALVVVQGQRNTATYANPLGIMQYGVQLQRPFRSYLAQGSFQFARQSTEGLVTSNTLGSFGLSRIFGSAAVTLGATYSRMQLPLSDQITITPLLQISRRLSPSATVGVMFGQEFTRDRLNPQFNATSRVFNLTLSSPFAFGSGRVRGRANPKLPATITGTVIKDLNGSLLSSSAAISEGIGNVVVILDNAESQRTDLSGHFQFQFVKPGRHEVRLEPASLPRGVTSDQPFEAVELEGGEEAQMYFRVGAYGAVQGRVFGRDQSGTATPLEGVSLQIDDSTNATTTPSGAFGFGRLAPGKHVVKIIVQSLPASVNFTGDPTKSVLVRTGEVTPLDFVTDPLGSIEGHVLYDSSLGTEHSGGVINAYVVANPGDHAAITNDDGSFLLDNLPAGTYTLEVDPETLPEDTGVISGSQTLELKTSEHQEGVLFTVGHQQKAVVFSLHQDVAPATLVLAHPVLPPAGATPVHVDTPEAANSVVVTAFNKQFVLTPDATHKRWTGLLVVPVTTPAGAVEVTAEAAGGKGAQASAQLRVDSSMALATFTLDPPRPARGQYVRVRARFLADVRPGTEILWHDGQRTLLTRPISGRVYSFTVKISLYPLPGLLLIDGSKLPIILR